MRRVLGVGSGWRERPSFGRNGRALLSRRTGILFDWLCLLLAPLAAFLIQTIFISSPPNNTDISLYLAACTIVTGAAFLLFRIPNRLWAYTSLSDVSVITATVALSLLLATAGFLEFYPRSSITRTMPFLYFAILTISLLGPRIAVRSLRAADGGHEDAAAPGRTPDHVILVGVNSVTDLYLRAASAIGGASVEVVGIVDEDPSTHGFKIRSQEILGAPRDLLRVLQDLRVRGIDVKLIVMCCSWSGLAAESREVLSSLEAGGCAKLVPLQAGCCFGLVEVEGEHVRAEAGSAGRRADRRGNRAAQLIAPESGLDGDLSGYFRLKRWLDVAAASGLAIVLSPLIVIIWIVVALTMGAPCIFWQKRPGRNGRIFKIYKFRSMLSPCDANGNRIPDEQRQNRAGRLLRALRLDELPQLYNVLAGDMSLVGPRPLLPEDQPRRAVLRERMRPGVTGWAQVNGGRLLSAEEKLALDLWYARNATIWLDLKIVFLSLVAAARGDRKNHQAIAEAVEGMHAPVPNLARTAQARRNAGRRNRERDSVSYPKGRAPLYVDTGG